MSRQQHVGLAGITNTHIVKIVDEPRQPLWLEHADTVIGVQSRYMFEARGQYQKGQWKDSLSINQQVDQQ